MANEFVGASKYLIMADESTWGVGGTGSGSGFGTGFAGTYFYIPVEDYNVKFKPESRQAKPYLGIFQHANSKNFRGMPSGQLVTPLYGFHAASMSTSIMEYLLSWAFGSHETLATPSKLAQWAEGPNVANKQHNGLRVNQATLAGSSDNMRVMLTLDLMGKSETGNDILSAAGSIPDDKEKLVEVEYSDCTFQIAGVTVQPSSFQLQAQYALKPEYLNSFTPVLLLKTDRILTYTITLPKNADTYDAMNRATSMQEFTGQIVINGLHNGTGTGGTNWTRNTIAFPRLAFVNSESQGGHDDIAMNPIQMNVLKPDTSSNGMTQTFSEAA